MGDADQSAWVDVPDADVAAQVQNLLQVYALWVDAGRRDDIATLFTEDAEWDGTELGYGAATGAADIARHLAAFIDPTKPMMHIPGPSVLTAVSPTDVA